MERIERIDAFLEYVSSNIGDVISSMAPEYADIKVVPRTVSKNNGVECHGITLASPVSRDGVGVQTAPVLYLDELWAAYRSGKTTISGIMSICARRFVSVLEDLPRPLKNDIEKLLSLDNVRELITPRLVNLYSNKDVLTDLPHKIVEDLAVTYAVTFESGEGDDDLRGSVKVTKQLLDSWGITVDELHSIAMENAHRNGHVCRDINGVLVELLSDADLGDQLAPSNAIFVIGNKENFYGASAVLDPEFMDQVADMIGGDGFYLLPSSIHEFLAVHRASSLSLEDLSSMVESVNDDASTIATEDVLSYSVYQYDSAEHTLRIVVAGRSMEKEAV